MVYAAINTVEELRAAMNDQAHVIGLDVHFCYEETLAFNVSSYIANAITNQKVETTPETVAISYQTCVNLLSDELKNNGHLVYDGYCAVLCSSIGEFLFEVYTHFLGEGLEGEELQTEWAKIRAAFIENGYVAPDQIAERFDEDEDEEDEEE